MAVGKVMKMKTWQNEKKHEFKKLNEKNVAVGKVMKMKTWQNEKKRGRMKNVAECKT